MYWIHGDETELTQLRRKGFTERQIARLYQLRKRYGEDEMDQPALDRRYLEFACYLVATGRLSEQMPAPVVHVSALVSEGRE